MKKVGIITLCGNSNFGNKLQNYAIIYSLTKMGINSETIWVENAYKANFIKQFLKKCKRIILDHIINRKRNIRFVKFNKSLNIKKRIVYNNDIQKKCKDYDCIFVGSDQVWNPALFSNDSIYLLEGINTKKISISASFGVDYIPDERKESYKKGLNDFDMISVREERGKKIIEELINRNDVEVLIDPTMMLDSDDWKKISKEPSYMKDLKNKKYILNYFLGNLSQQRKQEIRRIAKENNCHIINILDKKDPFYNCGPREFLYLEEHAFLICTDSFHSSVFAILFNKPFIIFDREGLEKSMSSRIDTLLKKFKLENRRYNEKSITIENMKHDYTNAYMILNQERQKMENYIQKALNHK